MDNPLIDKLVTTYIEAGARLQLIDEEFGRMNIVTKECLMAEIMDLEEVTLRVRIGDEVGTLFLTPYEGEDAVCNSSYPENGVIARLTEKLLPA